MKLNNKVYDVIFQSTPPARGGDSTLVPENVKKDVFQSTPPARGATEFAAVVGGDRPISIHAPPRGGRHRRHIMYSFLK